MTDQSTSLRELGWEVKWIIQADPQCVFFPARLHKVLEVEQADHGRGQLVGTFSFLVCGYFGGNSRIYFFWGLWGRVFFCEKLKITVFFLLLFPRIYFKSMISRDKNHLQADSRIEGKEPDKNTDDCSPRLAAKLGGGCNSIVLGICYPQNTLGLGVS